MWKNFYQAVLDVFVLVWRSGYIVDWRVLGAIDSIQEESFALAPRKRKLLGALSLIWRKMQQFLKVVFLQHLKNSFKIKERVFSFVKSYWRSFCENKRLFCYQSVTVNHRHIPNIGKRAISSVGFFDSRSSGHILVESPKNTFGKAEEIKTKIPWTEQKSSRAPPLIH